MEKGTYVKKKDPFLRPTLEKMFSRELVREVRALFLRTSSVKRLPVAEPSPADELFAAFWPEERGKRTVTQIKR